MPPEPLPWDRKDFLKERRHDRPPADSLGPAPRWRNSAPNNGFRGRSPGNGRPGSWRYHSAESGRGFPPSRVNEKFIGDDSFSSLGYRMDGRYNRTNWDNKGLFGQKAFRGHSRESGLWPNSYGRPYMGSNHRSVDDKVSFGQEDPRGHFLENGMLNSSGRLHTGIDQRSFDDKGSFARKDWRGKSWETGVCPNSFDRLHVKNDQSLTGGNGFPAKKDSKDHSCQNGVLPNSSSRLNTLRDQRSLDDKGSFGQNDFRVKSCENDVLPNNCSQQLVGSDQSLVDGKKFFCPKDTKVHLCESVLPTQPGRLHVGGGQGPLDDMRVFTSPMHSDLARTQDELHLKDQNDKSSSANDLAPARRFEKENSLGLIGWKPLKWTRSGSLSSRGSGFSHSSCAKSTESNEVKAEIPPCNATPLRSPSGDAVACVTLSAVSSEETGSRKKPRLKWGEGLAKVEKKKVEGPDDDSATKPGLGVCASGEHSHLPNLADKSPGVAGFLDCASPATPSSVACSSSPGALEKACTRPDSIDFDASYLSGSPNLLPQYHLEGVQGKEFCLENLELTSVANLSSSLVELFQLADPAILESSFVRSTAMSKLLLWKGEILKALELTESEIDLLENDVKNLISDTRIDCSCPATSTSVNEDCHSKPCEVIVAGPNTIPRPAPLQVISSGETEKADGGLGGDHSQIRNEDLDTPTSKFVEPLNEVGVAASSDSVKNDSSCDHMDVDVYGFEGVNTGDLSGPEGGGQLMANLSSDREEALCDRILATNKDIAIRTFEVFKKLLPPSHCGIDVSRSTGVTSWKDDHQIMKKFACRKRCRRFQERVNTIKFRALRHLWKEDLQLLSVKKNQSKSQKRLELSSRASHSSNQKHRSFRSRFSNAGTNAGRLTLVPAAKMIKITNKLLYEPQFNPFRDTLKMPVLIMDEKEKLSSRFISNNGLVEDPCAVEKERSMINPWTKEEMDIFMDKLAVLGKDFKKISSFLDHKTTADCVVFYYKNHKSDCFVKLKKKPDFAKQGKSYPCINYLVTSGKRWSREINAASLDVLGEASEIAANADHAMETCLETRAPQTNGLTERSHNIDAFVNQRETEAADVLAGICGSISSEAMSSCVTSSFDRGESYKGLKNHRVDSDDEMSSDDSCGEIEPSCWTDEEKSILIQAVSLYGNDFAMISRHVGTKSRDQCKVFFSKARKCLGLDSIRPRSCGESMPGEDDNDGGGSDNEGTCVVETDSVVCSDKGDTDILLSDLDMNDCRASDLEMKDCKLSDEMEKISTDDLAEETKPVVGLEGGVEMRDDVENKPMTEPEPMIAVLPPDTEEDRGVGEALSSVGSVSAEAANGNRFSMSYAEVGPVDAVQGSGEPQAVEQEMKSENNLIGKQDPTRNCLTDLNCADQDLHDNENELDLMPAADAHTESNLSLNQEQKLALDLNPPLESLSISLGGDDCHVDRASVAGGVLSRSEVDFESIIDKLYKKSSADTCTQHQSSPSVFVGHPIQVATERKMNGDMGFKKPVSLQMKLKVDGDYHFDTCVSQDCFLRNCIGGAQAQSSAVEISCHSHEQKRSHSRHHSWSSSDSEKPSRNGDVKLFGQILTQSSSKPKQTDNSIPEKEDMGSQHPKSVTKNINQQLTVTDTNIVDSSTVIGKHGCNNHLCLENVHTNMSFDYWGGNKTQTFPSLPDSAILLAKYPAAFHNLSCPSNLHGVSVFSSREMSSGSGLVNYPYRNQQDIISEMQRRNGIGAFSSSCSSAGAAGTSVGISDPVAAIKFHYANVEQYSGQNREHHAG